MIKVVINVNIHRIFKLLSNDRVASFSLRYTIFRLYFTISNNTFLIWNMNNIHYIQYQTTRVYPDNENKQQI